MTTDLRLLISIDDQKLRVLTGSSLVREFIISTAAKGVGFTADSHRTPTGHFQISEKIGSESVSGTIFTARVPVGIYRPMSPAVDDDLILTRILRLEGLDPENANTRDRYIYLHGTNREDQLGKPTSHGCIRMANQDIIALFDLVRPGTPLEILAPTLSRGKLFFIDCDSTLSTIEGIDELARARGAAVFQNVVSLTNAAMNGEIPLDEVFPRRMEIIQPDRDTCEAVARLYLETITPGARELITHLKSQGWTPIILSGGFAPLIQPLARELGIDHLEAVPLILHADGTYAGYGIDYPTTRSGGKNEIIREWKAAMLPTQVIMMGDGASDLETQPDVDLFVGYGGVVRRPKVMAAADLWIEEMADFATVKYSSISKRHA
jgi:phosphoserine phosphatase SerB